ncbi:MAG: hypothetical protein R3D66_05340 [Alphaproteobacteria bacterium]
MDFSYRMTMSGRTTHVKEGRLSQGSGSIWNLSYMFHDTGSSGPVCVMVPGYRSRGMRSKDNAKLTRKIITEAGLSVLSYDYSGCDHLSKKADPMTMGTQIKDTQRIVELIEDRAHIFIPKSSGINMALAAANQNTKAVVAALPIQDFYQTFSGNYAKKKHPIYKWAFNAIIGVRGVYCWKPSSSQPNIPFIKITRPYIESTENHTLDKIFNYNANRVPVTLIINSEDPISDKITADQLKRKLGAQKYPAKVVEVEGKRHILHDTTNTAIISAIQEFLP